MIISVDHHLHLPWPSVQLLSAVAAPPCRSDSYVGTALYHRQKPSETRGVYKIIAKNLGNRMQTTPYFDYKSEL